MSKLKSKTQSSGQALLLVVLAVGVMTVVGLSIVSRSISDVVLTTNEEESLRAFSAAEAGVEEVLVSGSTSGTLQEGASFNVTKSGFPDSSSEYVYPADISKGDSAILWLIAHDESNNMVVPSYKSPNLTLCWGKEGTDSSSSTTPAIEFDILYEASNGSFQISRGASDPYGVRRGTNNFASASVGGCTVDGVNFAFQKSLNLGLGGRDLPWSVDGGLKLIKVRMLYNDEPQPLGIFGDQNLPAQGFRVDSLGVSGQSSRRIEVFSLYPEPLSIFGAALYSNGVLQ